MGGGGVMRVCVPCCLFVAFWFVCLAGALRCGATGLVDHLLAHGMPTCCRLSLAPSTPAVRHIPAGCTHTIPQRCMALHSAR